MVDWDHLLNITKKNALQMIAELIQYNYKDHAYTFNINPTEVKITILIDRSLYGGIQVTFSYYDKDDNSFPIPYVHQYYEGIDWIIEDAANEFIEDVRNQWTYDEI
jgi:hypothetical protein